jgi:hypothetical protein
MLCRWILTALALTAGCAAETAGPGGRHGTTGPLRRVAVKPFRFADPDVVLLVTGGTHGLLELCNCSGPMPGGLARRSGLVQSYRAAFPRTFVLDLGDVFWVDPNDIRNDFVLTGYAQIGYDAVVPADQEWAAGTKHLAAIAARAGTTLLSTTIAGAPATTCPAVTRDWPGLRLAVVADVPREVFRFVPAPRVAELTFADPNALARRVRQLKRDGFAVVVAAHVDEPYLGDVIAAVDADLFLRGHTGRTDPALLRVAGKPVAKIGGSDFVGALALKVRDGRITDIDYRAELVNEAWPVDGRLLETYQAYAHAAMRQALDAERTQGLDYMPSEACGRCHIPQYNFWAKTHHARAWSTLTKVRRTSDPACVMCHTSGFGTEKGFYTIEKTPQFANVNCQDCHRFNNPEHLEKGYLFEPVTKDICTTCHTPVTSPKFDFVTMTPKVRCPKSPRATRPIGAFRAADAATQPAPK